jgi:hypothetical protein
MEKGSHGGGWVYTRGGQEAKMEILTRMDEKGRKRMSMIRSGWLFSLLLVSATVAAQTPAQAPKPGPEQQRLEVFLGKWTQVGEAQASPYGPAGKLTSTDTFEWLPGGFFMLHRWEARQGAIEIKGTEILGYDARKRVYTSHFFDSFGNSGSYKYKTTPQGNTWTATGDTEVGDKPLKERFTVDFGTPATSFSVKAEYSTDGAKWLPNYSLTSTRAK